MRFAYFYLMRDEPTLVRTVAAAHAEYWRGLNLRGYEGGPLADLSGGLITFEADSLDQANALIADDPFVKADVLAAIGADEWRTVSPSPA
jgi:uncharacterized protein YciI